MTDKRPLIIFGIAALVVLTFFVVIRSSGPRYNWFEDYKEENKDPYGTFVVQQLLDGYFPEESFEIVKKDLPEELPIDSQGLSNYVFIGEGLYIDSADVATILDFVEKGNTAFISSKTIPYLLMDEVHEFCDSIVYWQDFKSIRDTSVYLSLQHPQLRDPLDFQYKFIRYNKVRDYAWNYIDSSLFCAEPHGMVELGMINERYYNFARKDYGAGSIYLHSNPIAFSNIQLLDTLGLDYASKVFTHLAEGPIYWDRSSRVPLAVAQRLNQNQGGDTARESPLQYILSQAPLAWAWYLSLMLGLLYLLFRAKRKQRIIPVLHPNTNSSMEFISTIGTLYFLQNDHRKLCLQKMKLFLAYLRERYFLSTKDLDNTFVERVAAKSEISQAIISKILLYYKNIQSSSFVSEQTLIEFHLEMEKFYKNCK